MNQSRPNNEAGKGDKPRNCFSDSFKNNYNSINWKIKKDKVLFVGDFVKAVLKIICIINEIKYFSIAMESRCDEIITMLLKNIVNNQSLYIN